MPKQVFEERKNNATFIEGDNYLLVNLLSAIWGYTMKITKTELKEIIEGELRDYYGGKSHSPDLQIPGYGVMTVEQVERKLARLLREAAKDAPKDPPQ